MTDRTDYPERLFLPPEAFDGFSKYLNIYGQDHVCDGEPYAEFALVDRVPSKSNKGNCEEWLWDFVTESNLIEGIDRTPTAAEMAAHIKLITAREISIHSLSQFVHTVQPGSFLREDLGMNVQVGDHKPIIGGPVVVVVLNELLHKLWKISAFEAYCRYETLHPFMDGNGRSGRALWLGMMVHRFGHHPSSFLREFHYQALSAHDSQPPKS